MMAWINYLEQQTDYLITNFGISAPWAIYCRMAIFLLVLFILCSVTYLITKKFIVQNLYKLFRKTAYTWDDLLIEHKVFETVANLVPAILVRVLVPIIFRDFTTILPFLVKITEAYLILVSIKVIIS